MPTPEERALFLAAVGDAKPLKLAPRLPPHPDKPLPVPVQSLLDDHATLVESVTGPIPWEESMETGEELSFLRPGLARDVLRKLRRGNWVMQGELDLHGHIWDEARLALSGFLALSLRRGARCLRIVHGKGLGSRNREPVLKKKVKTWLAQREEVLAFCQAPDTQGGGGALLVLLRAPKR